jgi:hypothetical protein
MKDKTKVICEEFFTLTDIPLAATAPEDLALPTTYDFATFRSPSESAYRAWRRGEANYPGLDDALAMHRQHITDGPEDPD